MKKLILGIAVLFVGAAGATVPAGTGEQIAGSEARSAPDPAKYYNKYASCDNFVAKR